MKKLKNIFLAIFTIGLLLFVTSFCIFPLKGSAMYELIHADLLRPFVLIFLIYSVLTTANYIIVYLVSLTDVVLSKKLNSQLAKLGLLLSIVIGLLVTESSDHFQLIATLISFVLIFQFFIPKGLPKTLQQIELKLIRKRNNNASKKDNK